MIAAPLFIISVPELVITKCKAGIVGSFPALKAWVTQIRDALDRHNRANPDAPAAPFAVNQIEHRSNSMLDCDLEICTRHKVPIWITSLGARVEVNEATHTCGCIVLHDIINDTFALIREIRDWFDGPPALSDAIATGEALLAARVLGVDFGYTGSPFIATDEANAQTDYRDMIVQDIVNSSLFTGVWGNYLRGSVETAGLDPDNLPQADPSAMNFASGSTKPKGWITIWGSGQGIGAVKPVGPARAIVDRMAQEYAAAGTRKAAEFRG